MDNKKKKWILIIVFLICYIFLESWIFLTIYSCGMMGSNCGSANSLLEPLFLLIGIVSPILLILFLKVKSGNFH